MTHALDRSALWPPRADRIAIQGHLSEVLADAIDELQQGPVAPPAELDAIRAELKRFDFHEPMNLVEATEYVTGMLKDGTVHMMHPGYMGLFNPSVVFPGILADQIAASLNPQLAVWSHAPVAVEIERHTILAIGGLCGWTADKTAGHFTSGGAEANYTGVLMALTRACPGFSDGGARAFSDQPRLYVSVESHLAWLQIAHRTGIGRDAVRLVSTDGTGRMDADALAVAIEKDRRAGDVPVFVGATAGTTNAGMIDPLEDCRRITRAEGLWFHVDAAWGGAGLLSAQSAEHLKGIKEADSITLDAHKWFAVPMGAGIFLCRDNQLLGETFRVSASYMPSKIEAAVDPYTHSVQWSRRFIGLKMFLSLACMGWEGYRAHVEHALEMAGKLRALLVEHDWRVVNDSPLAVVCFADARGVSDAAQVADDVVGDGRTWISAVKFEGRAVLRACITSHFTREEHLRTLVHALDQAREAERKGELHS